MSIDKLKETWNLQYNSGTDTALKDKNLFQKEIHTLISQLKLNINFLSMGYRNLF